VSVSNCKSVFKPLLLSAALALAGCDSVMNSVFSSLAEKNLPKVEGALELPGLQNQVSISRDEYGVPLVEADNMSDLAMGLGYMMAQDRLAQMTSMALLAQGRLSEMTGELSVDMDMYMRTLNLKNIGERKYERLSDDFKALLDNFSRGVNAYIEQHPDALPLEFRSLGSASRPTARILLRSDCLLVTAVSVLLISLMSRDIVCSSLAKCPGMVLPRA